LRLLMKINGVRTPQGVVPVPPGPVQLTLDVVPGLFSEPLDFYFGVVVQGQLVWLTAGGLSTTPAPLSAFVPVTVQNASIVNTNLTSGATMTFVMLLARGSTVLAYDWIVAAAF
jgi:hypothetical protein